MIIGLTGSIGSGKSTVSARLALLGARVLDADEICRELCVPGGRGTLEIARAFPGTVNSEGVLDRRALAKVVFADEGQRVKLNGILHPMVLETLFANTGAGAAVTVWDVPLLIECSWQGYCDEVWLVSASRETRIARVMLRDGCTAAEAEKRMAAQMDDDEKALFATRVINNDGDMEELISIVDALYAQVSEGGV